MKVITMESSAFTALTEQIAEIAAHVRAVSGESKGESPDRLLTTREAAHLLNVSCRTLQRMRSEQRIAYVVLRGKCRYRQSEIDRLLEDSTITGDAATPEQMHVRIGTDILKKYKFFIGHIDEVTPCHI